MTTVVIMAGGRGLRLHPLTEHTPKPLVKLGQKPMLENVLDGFIRQGFTDFVFCVHYLAELIEGYFGNGSKWKVSIRYVRESEPLGTAGALRLMPVMQETFIVCNADVLAGIDYHELLRDHNDHGSIATMCLALYQHQVPFGVASLEGPFLSGILEKPIESWLVNAGVYVIDPDLVKHVPANGPCDMPDLLSVAPGFVRAYQITGHWIDVGRFEDLTRAREMVA